MIFHQWRAGDRIVGPAYLDANIWIGYVVSGHRLARQCALLFAALLQSRVEILVSDVMYQEALWAIAGISSCDVARQPHGSRFTREIYRRHRQAIWQRYGPRFRLMATAIRDLANAGVPIRPVPDQTVDWRLVLDRGPDFMEALALESGDAIHLALAATYGQTFITGDGDFRNAAGRATAFNLTILHVSR